MDTIAGSSNRDEALGRMSRWFRFNVWLHRWSSLIATPFFFVLCVTGTILIFHHEIEDLLGTLPEVTVPAGATRAPLAPMLEEAHARAAERKAMYVFWDPDEPERVAIGMGPQGATKFDEVHPSFFNAYTGEYLKSIDFSKTLSGFMLTLHANWFLDLPGQLFGGVIALLVVLSLLSGLVVYAPYVKRIAFGVVRGRPGSRLKQLDLHNLIGVVVLGWAFIVSLTGVFLALASIAIQVWANTELKEMVAKTPPATEAVAAPRPSIDAIVATAQEALPHRELRFITFPGTELSGDRHYTALLYGRSGYDDKLFEIVMIEAATGRITDIRPAPWYLKLIMLSEPLHFGDYGGLPLQLLWFACTWLTMYIVGNGAWLWWTRRSTRRRSTAMAGAQA
ncbi:MAG TPA: PepSY-associated TM helix domain-containing protein [Burkholderiales bacterium]|nr:PepSY domain-containing protein [Betaproteobacteria bacterium]HQR54130.1 PepSY-associated TM helix domain-containing protein [Burkholderiales bacterium]